MKNLLIFDAGRRGRLLSAPALAAATLAILLLGVGSGQSAAMGPGLVAAPPAQGSVAPPDIGVLAANDVSIVKSVSKSWVMNGAWINYTLRIANGSTAMSGVVVTDPLPVELTNVTSSSTLPYSVVGNTFVIGSLVASQTGVITINGRISTGHTGRTLITNTATITATGDTNTANNTSTAVTTFWSSVSYLPIIFRGTGSSGSTVNWVDNFNNSKSGWVASGDGCTGSYDTSKGRYKVTISSGHKGKSCIIYNYKTDSSNPLGAFPRQFEGTFMVRVRRTSSNSYPLLYGFQFDTAADSSDASGTRWALEAWPQSTDTGCDDDKGFYWLTAQEYYDDDGHDSHTDMYWNHEDDSGHDCTSAVELQQNWWTEMAAVRHSNIVSVYIRNFENSDGTDIDNIHSHDYVSVPTIVAEDPSESLGWTQMRVVSNSSSEVKVEFDRIEIHSSITPPW